MNLPNSITLSRICSIPLLIWILTTNRFSSLDGQQELLASALFIAAAITDGIDGYLARKRGQITTMGMLLDPLADKLLIAAAFIVLVQFNPQPGAGVDCCHYYRTRVPGQRVAFDRSFGGIYHRSQRIGQVQDGGADRVGGRRDSWTTAGKNGSVGRYFFSVHWVAILAIWFMVVLSLVSAFDYFKGFWSKIDRQAVRSRRRAFVLRRRAKNNVPAKNDVPAT